MVKAGNPLRGVFVVAPIGAAQLNHFIGSFPKRGYTANPPSVCLSRPLVFQNVPTEVFKGDVRLSGESRNLRHPPPQPPRRFGRQPNQSQKSPKSNKSQFKTRRPPPATNNHPTGLSAERRTPRPLPTFRRPTSRRRRHAPHPSFRRTPESPRPRRSRPPRSERQPNQSQKSPKSNKSQFKTRRPPPATTQPPPPVFRAKPANHFHTPHSQFRIPPTDTSHFPTPNTPPYHNIRQPQNVPL